MTTRKSANWALLLFGACMCLILFTDGYAVRKTPFGADQQLLNYALLFDFVFVIPFMYWLLIARKKGGGMLKVIQAAVPCLILAWVMLPASGRSMLMSAPLPLKLSLSALEMLLVIVEARLAFGIVKRVRGNLRVYGSTAEALRLGVANQAKPSTFSSLIVNDILMVYYLLFSWRRKAVTTMPDIQSFSYHRKTGQIVLAAVFTHVIAIEAFGMHMLLRQWSDIAAWILTAADLWLLSLLWADGRASAIQPLEVHPDRLRIRYGMRIQADVPFDRIACVDTALEFHPDKEESKDAALPVVTPNVRVILTEPIEVQLLLFMPRRVTSIYLALDEPAAFAQVVRQKCNAPAYNEYR